MMKFTLLTLLIVLLTTNGVLSSVFKSRRTQTVSVQTPTAAAPKAVTAAPKVTTPKAAAPKVATTKAATSKPTATASASAKVSGKPTAGPKKYVSIRFQEQINLQANQQKRFGSLVPFKILKIQFGARKSDYATMRNWGGRSRLHSDRQAFLKRVNEYLSSKEWKKISPHQKKILIGTCPHAQMMGFEHFPPQQNKGGLPMCSHLKVTCCSIKSMYTFKSKWAVTLKKLSSIMWSMSKFPTMINTLMSHMNGQMRHCTSKLGTANMHLKKAEASIKKMKEDALKKKDVITKAAAPTKPADIEKEKAAQKAMAATAAKKSANEKADKEKEAKTKATKAQAVKSSAAMAKAAAAKSTTAKPVAPKTAATKRRLWVFPTILKKRKGQQWKSTPSHWNEKNPVCLSKFTKAWNSANNIAISRGDLYRKTSLCLKALTTLKNQVACAACKPVNGKDLDNFKDGMNVMPRDTLLVQTYCGTMFNQLVAHQGVMKDFLYYLKTVFHRRIITKAFDEMFTWQTPDISSCIPDVVGQKTQANIQKEIAEITLKNKKANTKPTAPAKRRILQAAITKNVASKPTAAKPTAAKPTAAKPTAAKPTAAKPTAAKPTAAKPTAAKPTADNFTADSDTDDFEDDLNPKNYSHPDSSMRFKSDKKVVIDSWTAWQYSMNTNVLKSVIVPSKACWASPVMRTLVKDLIYGNSVTSLKRLIAPLWGAMRISFKYAGNSKAWKAWDNFEGNKRVFIPGFVNVGSHYGSFDPKGRTVDYSDYTGMLTQKKGQAKATAPKKRQLKHSARNMQKTAEATPKYEQKLNLDTNGILLPRVTQTTGGLDIAPELKGDEQANPASSYLHAMSHLA